jgi:hypothetical protein
LRRFTGRRYPRAEAYWMAVGAALGPAARRQLVSWLKGHDAPVVRVPRDYLGFNANGWQGQFLAVYPGWKLIVIRQRRPTTYTEAENKRYGFWRFFKLAEQLVPKPKP